ncbi:MAG: preprotein translocase subunit SecY [Candidatus Methylarchaceae archaeon HK02M1]|nr:preprotein translocase subunit SecY [Candidatus Methylarchaceae archaeon HK01M]MCP8312221.1 preprotein translocase subunit SecY [Candidatus Methylarchaceae archaeon HK02M1]
MSSLSGFLRGISTIMPEVPAPQRKLSLTMKLIWTAIALAVYLIMAETPLYGITTGGTDPLAYSRIIFASNQGTLMEFGIGPIVTAGLVMQLLKGAEMIKLDFKKPEDRALFTSATKLLTMVVILVQSLGYIIAGIYGSLSFTTMIIIVMQLFVASVIVMLLDELVQKGWGIGSGISLFIMAGVAQQIMWSIFNPLTVNIGSSEVPKIVPFGFIPFLIDALIRGAPYEAIVREGALPSLIGFLMTMAVILFLIYIEGVRVEIPISSSKYRGFSGVYPIKLLYVSVVPVIFASVLLTDVVFISQFIWTSFNPTNTNIWLNWLGTGIFNGPEDIIFPTGGLVYYMSPIQGLSAAVADPLRALSYVFFMVLIVTIFSKLWVAIGGLAPKDVAKSLLDADVHVPGFRRAEASVGTILARYIPPITILGGIVIGLLASLSDILGVFGSGTGILLMIGIIMQYYQILMKEQLETMMPRLAGIFERK